MLRFLLWLTARLPVEEISHQGVTFMERYYVATLGAWRVYIHRFVASDPDGLHDHPWGLGFALILSGWYFEARRDRVHTRTWGNMVNGETFHRVLIPQGCEAWTLFAHNLRCKPWGFLRQHRVSGFDGDPYIYVPLETARAHSDWHLSAPKGRDIRRTAA